MNLKQLTSLTLGVLSAFWMAACSDDVGDPLTDSEFSAESDQDALSTISAEADDSFAGLVDADDDSLGYGFASAKVRVFGHGFRSRLLAACAEIERSVSGNTVTVTRTYDSCQIGSGPVIDGSVVRRMTIEDVDDAVDRQIEVTRDLTITKGSNVRTIQAENSGTWEGTFPNLTHTKSIDIHRTHEAASGKRARDYTVKGNLTYSSSGDSDSIDEVVLDGSLEINHQSGKRLVDYTFDGVTWDESCRGPVSGQITKEVTKSNGKQSSHTIVFEGECGKFMLDDNEMTQQSFD